MTLARRVAMPTWISTGYVPEGVRTCRPGASDMGNEVRQKVGYRAPDRVR